MQLAGGPWSDWWNPPVPGEADDGDNDTVNGLKNSSFARWAGWFGFGVNKATEEGKKRREERERNGGWWW
jgi:hypothetical protein